LDEPDRRETGYVVALDVETGTERWRTSMSVEAPASPVVHDGTLYVDTSEAGLLALDADTGQQRWA
ncbi:MAG TPA: PQQ-binding-like beta-propeller repeat protein, partial [Thermomicrobiales bacterium]|nr:PQQ-binding-like beta-propeller repeat protein [Thermomicrobiales bacterium]